jgi:hypothetical protein
VPVDDRVIESRRVQEVLGDALHLLPKGRIAGVADQQAELEPEGQQVEPLGLLAVLVVLVRAGQAGQLLLQLVSLLGGDPLP